MRLPAPSKLAALLAAPPFLAACAAPGPYPSLEPRPIEKALAESEEEPAAPVRADDPGLDARIAPLVAEARRGAAEFQAALPAAQKAAAGAGAPESDSWVEAQQALSRLEAASALTGKALADLDALAMAEAQARALSPGDIERLEAAVREAQAIAERQRAESAAISARIGGG
jgi:hypothetical protein